MKLIQIESADDAPGERAEVPDENLEAARRSMAEAARVKKLLQDAQFELTACRAEAAASSRRASLAPWRISCCTDSRFWCFAPLFYCEITGGDADDSGQPSRLQMMELQWRAEQKVHRCRGSIVTLKMQMELCNRETQMHLARAHVGQWRIVKTKSNINLFSYDEQWMLGVWARMVAAADNMEDAVLAVFSAPTKSTDPVSPDNFDDFFAGYRHERRAQEFIDECSELYGDAKAWQITVKIDGMDYMGVFPTVDASRRYISALEDMAAVDRKLTVAGPSIVRLSTVPNSLRTQMRRKETHAALIRLASAALAK